MNPQLIKVATPAGHALVNVANIATVEAIKPDGLDGEKVRSIIWMTNFVTSVLSTDPVEKIWDELNQLTGKANQ